MRYKILINLFLKHPSIVIDIAPALYLYVSGDKRRPKDYNLLIELD